MCQCIYLSTVVWLVLSIDVNHVNSKEPVTSKADGSICYWSYPLGRFIHIFDDALLSPIIISILVTIIRQVIVACSPAGLGRVALCMIIANISQRSSMIHNETLWSGLHDATLDSQQGSLHIQLLALVWFTVVEEHGSSLLLN